MEDGKELQFSQEKCLIMAVGMKENIYMYVSTTPPQTVVVVTILGFPFFGAATIHISQFFT